MTTNTATQTSPRKGAKKVVKKAVKKVVKKAVKAVAKPRQIDPKAATNVSIPDRHQRGTVEGLDLGTDRKIYLTSNKAKDDGSRSAAINIGGVTISGKAKAVRGKWVFTRNEALSDKAESAWDERMKKLKDAQSAAKKASGSKSKSKKKVAAGSAKKG